MVQLVGATGSSGHSRSCARKWGCLEWKQKEGVKEQVQLLPSFTSPTPPPDPISSSSPPPPLSCPALFTSPTALPQHPTQLCPLSLPSSLTDPSYSSPGEGIRAPSFSSYLYFLFCPTLIYRETYPR